MQHIRVGVVRHTVFAPSERFIPDQVRAIPDCTPTIVCRDPVVSPVPGVRVREMPFRSRTDRLRYVLAGDDSALRELIREEGFELLHAHFGVEGLYSRAAAERTGIPQVVTLHGFDVSYTRRALLAARTPSWARYAVRRRSFLRSGSLLVCVSEHVRRLAVALGAPEERTTVLTTGVDTALLQPSAVPAEPRVVHVARLVEKKGTTHLIEAVRRASRALPEISLDIIGTGPLLEPLRAQVAAGGLEGRVRFLGSLAHAEVIAAMRSASVVAVPSVTARSGDTEGLPQVVLEAGALGRPVVGTRHAGIGEAVLESTGVLVAERDEAGLAAALVEVAGAPDIAAAMGAAARDRVVDHFDLRRQALRLRELYAAELR